MSTIFCQWKDYPGILATFSDAAVNEPMVKNLVEEVKVDR